MTPATWGMVLGAAVGLGVLLVASRLVAMRRPSLDDRVLPYIRDLPPVGKALRPQEVSNSPGSALRGVFGPVLKRAADAVEKILGGSTSVRRRLERANLSMTVHDFRVEQVLWGVGGFVAAAFACVIEALSDPRGSVTALLLCCVAFAVGVILRDQRLSSQVQARERKILVEFPTVAELLALSVAAGESPVTALERVVRRTTGELSADLARVLADARTGLPIGLAFDRMAARSGLPMVARFAEGIAVAIDRGTPLADVLHAQAADVREAGRRELIESAARKEVAMMIPVVFLVMPITILFAFYPGVIGLSLSTP